MKAAFAFLGLAASVLATGGQDWDKGKTVTKTTVIDVVYTTTCPVTETIHKPGKVETTTFTTTSVVWTKVPTVIYTTLYGADKTETAKEVVHVTHTKFLPTTETKVLDGQTRTITYTKTQLVEEVVPTTIKVYTTQETTKYVKTEVHETVTCPVTTYTTVIEGETKTVVKTNTITVKVTDAITVTELRPVTRTANVDQTVKVTVPGGVTTINSPTVVVTMSGTQTQTIPGPPGTVVTPTTLTTSRPAAPPATSAPATTSPVPAAGARIDNAPALALLAGLLGAVALL
ncbi:hypothetical protein GGTG_10057 [Gaeumannomyces tritici R3-111a-1]|uniref:Repetitive proline-rich cell wall protein n=1 Tax=Gaeumannomyces tritici (strain R3-111a-1) TaxID=644352 RepID=J3P972_GAET3|nr:hypothetical protein GGTG_10057 [Gaeumannomyces tritici R3-111a-1]EJT73208.1 hypothetical protein GGTG_10057 [Gaeumannomyces tritici R3-111a-1]